MTLIKAALYIRVSTTDQNPENQRKVLKEYCKRLDYTIYDIYEDHGESGLNDSRPSFNKLLKDMRRRKFNTIIVWKLDRIGRSLQHLLTILQELKKKKIDLICTSQNIDTTTAAGKLMFQIMGAFAEFESTLISERTKLGMARAKEEGKHIGRPRKDPKIYTRYCSVSGCREKIELTRRVCHKHRQFRHYFEQKKGYTQN